MINTPKVTSSVTNSSRVQSGETWGSITTSWATETRTWERTGSLMTNSSKQTSSVTNQPKP